MFLHPHSKLCLLAALALPAVALRAQELKPCSGAGWTAADDYFADEVWTKVAAQSCVKCHRAGGDAEDSKLVLKDPKRIEAKDLPAAMQHNRESFLVMAKTKEGADSRLLLKATGKLDHEGEQVLPPDSAGYKVLAEFVRRAEKPGTVQAPPPEDKNAPPFFDGVVMVDDYKLLRRVTLSLAGRLPAKEEAAAVASQGLKAMPALLDAVMKEDGFYARLREGFNDIFLTIGQEDNAETLLSYTHFEKTRNWAEKHDLSHITDEKKRQQARYKLYDDYREAILGEPMRLIEYIVRHDHPFTEIITADYIMVTPYSARGYGIFNELKPEFKNPDDPFEYIPVKLKALKSGNKDDIQDSPTGFYPHAGVISTFQYLRRYPTTETNRNRQRARVYFLHFLGVDILDLAARVSDAAAVTAKYEIPTMQASECVVCHKTLDPIAGCFQDYWRFEGVYGKRKEGWFKDMFGPGYEGEDLPPQERWRALQWLGEHTVKDPRFAVAMVEHAVYLLTGRKALLPSKDLEDPLYPARHRAYLAQRKQIEAIAGRFARNGFNFKSVLKEWILSDFYRADGLASATATPARRAELEDIGLMRMLAPEQVERKVAAIFGKPWGKLRPGDGGLNMLYGGIDSKEVTERATDPSGAMGAIQRILANEVACKQCALDFTLPPAERLLFPLVEPGDLPGSSADTDTNIRKTILHLHERILGRHDTADAPEVERTLYLFTSIINDAAGRKLSDNREKYDCRRNLPGELGDKYPDPYYTVRAWRAVVTYLLRQREFLYE